VRTCGPQDDISEIASIMTHGRFRHLPVVVDGSLVGIVSIGDVVKKRIDQLETETDQLRDYLTS
jgi:CBS domain-containing protein